MIKVTVFTGTRAEYGLLYWLMKDIEAHGALCLQILVSGSHLSPEFGETYHQIEQDGFVIDEKVEILLSTNTAVGTCKSMGLGVIGFADSLQRLKPDVLVLLGDRFEALAIAQTALIMNIPVLHIHGGEITEGAYDDAIRHAITKLSFLHATAMECYARRVIQLGENPKRVYVTGAIGLDHLNRTTLMSKQELSSSINFDLAMPFFLLTYHPVTLAAEDPEQTFLSILNALENFLEFQIIITYPNADDGGRKIIPIIERYANENSKRVVVIPSLGQKRYLSAVALSSGIIGNSSSGIIEVPSFGVPTINIGERQKGRVAAKSVVHCATDSTSIQKAVKYAINGLFNENGDKVVNPYGNGEASAQILDMILSTDFTIHKTFYDLKG